MDNSVIPQQLLQSVSVSFLGIGMITPLLQSLGIPSPFHTLAQSGSNISAVSSGCHRKSSALGWSCPGGSMLMSRSSSASWGAAGSSGSSLFKSTLEKCSAHRSSVPSQLSASCLLQIRAFPLR